MKNINYITQIVISGMILLTLFISACAQKPKPPENAQEVFINNEDMVRAKIDSTKKHTRGMSDADLIKKLEFDSERERESFNSLAFNEITRRENFKTDLLIESIKKSPNKTAFLSLLALRKIARKPYQELSTEFKISILIDALVEAKLANSWGIPHLYLEDGSKAILEIGEAIIPALTEHLGNCKVLDIWGSEEVMVFKEYGYRKCDFTLFYIMKIQEKNFVFPRDTKSRDRMISALTKQDD